MKLKIKDKVYLQKYEIAFILEELESIPGCVYCEFMDKHRFFSINGTEDKYNFDCVFENPESIKWLMEQDWIVDYKKFAKMSAAELISTIEHVDEEYTTKLDKFNAKDDTYRSKHYSKAVEEFGKYEHQLESLSVLLAAKTGKLNFTFPENRKKKDTFNPLKRLLSRNAH